MKNKKSATNVRTVEFLKSAGHLLLFLFGLLVLWFGVQRLLQMNILLVDERDGYDQIMRFTRSVTDLNPEISSVRGYHLAVAMILRLIGNTSTAVVRYTVTLVNLLAVVAVYLMARTVDPHAAGLKTLQFFFMPIMTLYFLLMYTDHFSTALVLFSILLTIRRRYALGALVAVISVFVRQTNIVWLLFDNTLFYLQEYGWNLSLKRILTHLSRSWLTWVGCLLFVVFVVVNGGFAVGQKEMHPLALSLENIYFGLFLLVILFLPLTLVSAVKVFRLVQRKPAVLLLVIPFFFLFLLTFTNSHPFNQYPWFIRNKMLMFFASGLVERVPYFAFIGYGILVLAVTKLLRKEYYLIYPASVLTLVPMTLVEQRYAMIPIALFLLFRKTGSPVVEYLTLALMIVTTVWLLPGIFAYRFFL
jgi:alpha-1,2-glucosyltransferase